MIPDISHHETTNMNAAHISIWEEEKSREGTQAFVFVPIATSCRALEPWLQFIASRVLPRKPLLTCFQARACLIENNQRGLSVWGAPSYEGVGMGGAWPDWERQNGNLMDSWIVGGVLLALRVPRIADSV